LYFGWREEYKHILFLIFVLTQKYLFMFGNKNGLTNQASPSFSFD